MRSRDGPGSVADDRGFATVLGAFVVAAVVGLTVTIVFVGAAVVARHRAQSGADLAALAGAGRAILAEPDPCSAARTVAAANHLTVSECVVDGTEVTVTADVAVALGPFGDRVARARARAGPAGDDPP
ncbi:Rv3654c family TadE-like protein [Williamsia deligens]|uniref:Rv3654c family TadE-like protein n=1 Tax=Williamsia deligens TaxID=321325 RepID=A0ABW3G603_9NOCA|nr:Rv3654c family TadE-like protein [Williamsia deligens]MCP2193261.1 helicase/secretion neighborhood TadE-like protein [Williamsia deligens]